MEAAPHIRSAVACDDAHLAVRFENGVEKTYDCRAILQRPEFFLLKTPAFFRAVRVDPGGCGVSWNDSMDLAGEELWANGVDAGERAQGDQR